MTNFGSHLRAGDPYVRSLPCRSTASSLCAAARLLVSSNGSPDWYRYCPHSIAENRHCAVHFGVAGNHRRYEADDVEVTLCPPQLEDQSFIETIIRDLSHFVIGRCLC